MILSPELIVMILLAIFGFIGGALWGHHGAIAKRVTYEDCNKKRQQCPCVQDIAELKANNRGQSPERKQQ